jgi:hypothetical protein
MTGIMVLDKRRRDPVMGETLMGSVQYFIETVRLELTI